MKPEVQQNLQVYFSKGWVTALDKLQVEVSSSLRLESSMPIHVELIILFNPEIHAIINNESPVREVVMARPTAALGGRMTSFAPVSSTEDSCLTLFPF